MTVELKREIQVSASRTSKPSNSRKLWLARMAAAGLIASTVAFGLAGTANALGRVGDWYVYGKDKYLGSVPVHNNTFHEAWTQCRSNKNFGKYVHSTKPDKLSKVGPAANCYASTHP
jgi:hypothetical protein